MHTHFTSFKKKKKKTTIRNDEELTQGELNSFEH